MDLLDSIQHHATRMIPGLAKLANKAQLLKKMDRPSLTLRRERGDAIETFEYLQLLVMHASTPHNTADFPTNKDKNAGDQTVWQN